MRGRGILRGRVGYVSIALFGFWWVLSYTLVFDICDESTFVISGICDDLGSAVREGNGV